MGPLERTCTRDDPLILMTLVKMRRHSGRLPEFRETKHQRGGNRVQLGLRTDANAKKQLPGKGLVGSPEGAGLSLSKGRQGQKESRAMEG